MENSDFAWLNEQQTQWLFVDEAGDPTLFNKKGRSLVGRDGCSRFFIVGKLEVEDPQALDQSLTALRQELLTDPYFAGVPSFQPQRQKTSVLLHAKDDLPEVRYQVFSLLREAGDDLRFHAVVCDKTALLQRERARRETATHLNSERALRLLVGYVTLPPGMGIMRQHVRIFRNQDVVI